MKVKFFMTQFILKFYKAFDRHVALDFYREGKIRGKNFYDTFSNFLLCRKFCGLCTMKVKFLRPNSYSNFIRLLTNFYREGKIRGKNFYGPFSDFLL